VGDEFKPGEPVPEALPGGRLRLPASMSVDDAAALLRTRWSTESTTVGGLVMEYLGHLPAVGERTIAGAFEFAVERVAGHTIEAVVARRVAAEPQEHSE
jgi:magnesium and cobalt transporter